MKRVISAGIATLAVLIAAATAHAADLPRRQQMPTKAPAYVAPVYNWTGFYVGINGGGGWGSSEWSALTGTSSNDVSGAVVGGTVGYNWQTGQFVFGVEGDADWSSIKGTTTLAPCTNSCETRNSWLATTRGRIGYAFDRIMPYVTGGAVFGDLKATPAGFAGDSETRVGWTIGGGAEFALGGQWTAKLEYLYADLGDVNCAAGNCAVPTNVDLTTSLVRGGINFRF
jgi:outer membrane immunogenic protein